MVDKVIEQCARGRDSRKILSPLSGMWKDCLVSADPQYAAVYHNDMYVYDESHWTITESGSESGTSGCQDTVNGWIKIYCDADDDDYVFFQHVGEGWKIADGKDIWFEARFALTETDTNKANWIFGLVENVGTGLLQAAGAGPPANYDGIVFFKVDGTMYIQAESSLATAQTTSATANAFASGTTYRIGFHVRAGTSTAASIDFFVDGSIKATHSLTYSGHGEMQLVFGIKAGGSGSEESLDIDYIKCVQLR